MPAVQRKKVVESIANCTYSVFLYMTAAETDLCEDRLIGPTLLLLLMYPLFLHLKGPGITAWNNCSPWSNGPGPGSNQMDTPLGKDLPQPVRGAREELL